jgi:hypothetical protein
LIDLLQKGLLQFILVLPISLCASAVSDKKTWIFDFSKFGKGFAAYH